MRGSCLVKKITESAKEIVYILCFIVIITDCLLMADGRGICNYDGTESKAWKPGSENFDPVFRADGIGCVCAGAEAVGCIVQCDGIQML